jgi:tRNA modification GTPase
MNPFSDLIAAVSTPTGSGALCVIRLSGPQVLKAMEKIFFSKANLELKPRTLVLGKIIDPKTGKTIDQALASFFPGPNSFTGEDSVEIQGHGGSTVPRLILEAALSAGARLAGPGEFTQRAFLNGKLSLDQAEAIADLVASQSEAEAALASRHLEGALSKALIPINDALKSLLVKITAALDFEEHWEAEQEKDLLEDLGNLIDELTRVLKIRQSGRIFRDGLRLVLAGPTNAGKSSLFNALIGARRALVSAKPGTTRDYLEAAVNWSSIRVELVDTAGLREDSQDEIEGLGQQLTKKELERADLVVWVNDLASEENSAPPEISNKLISVWNKADLEPAKRPTEGLIISALTGQGLEELKAAVLENVGVSPNQDPSFVPNLRQQNSLEECLNFLSAAKKAMEEGFPLDIIAIELNDAFSALGRITGRSMTEDILNEVFSHFCIGK